MVRTIKRANADDRWKVVSQKDPFSAADLESTPPEFTCSRGTRGEVNPAAQRLERHPVDALPPDPDQQSTDQWWPCTGHTEECRIRVEGELRKKEEGKARLRAAASRVGDAPTGHALKRVRFAENQDDNNAGVPDPTSESAPPKVPAGAASSSSAPTPSVDPALPASATGVPDQVMSEGASGSSDAAVRLSTKRSSDSSNSESATKGLHTDHSTRDVVMLLDDSDVSHAVERFREVCRLKRTFLSDVNDWDCESRDNLRAQMVQLLLAPVVEPPRNSCRMNRVSSISLLQPAMAMVTCRGKPL